jgi:hypothetical protein
MMNSYWAILLDVTDDNDIIRYGYTFRDRNMREAKLHAVDVCGRTCVKWSRHPEEHSALECLFATMKTSGNYSPKSYLQRHGQLFLRNCVAPCVLPIKFGLQAK